MNYAVIRIKGQQFKVKEGEKILTDQFLEKDISPEVLLIVKDSEVNIGEPVLLKNKVALKHLEEEKGEKIYVQKFKAKSRYRRRRGYRSKKSSFLVKSIV